MDYNSGEGQLNVIRGQFFCVQKSSGPKKHRKQKKGGYRSAAQ